MESDDGKITFLHQVSTATHAKNQQKVALGSETPLFRHSGAAQAGHNSLPSTPSELSDLKTALETAVQSSLGNDADEAKAFNVRPCIHMDAMAFGMGMCCLQITFQATDMDESRFLFDQLAVMAPIMMALTASTPVLKGRLADTDCRWGIISECVDDRRPAERGREGGPEPDPEVAGEFISPLKVMTNNFRAASLFAHGIFAGKGYRRLYKSRYDSISTFIFQGQYEESHMNNRILNMYNDIPVPIDEDKYRELRDAGIDPLLSQHIAHIFVRDPLVIFEGAIEEVDDETQTEHFESIQSTNW